MRDLRKLIAGAVTAAVLASAGIFISPSTEQYVKQTEKLELTPYRDYAGIWTDGWGNTKGVVPGRTITLEKAQADFEQHMRGFIADVFIATAPAPLYQGQLDAYVSLTYNIGGPAFRSSAAAAAHRAGDFPAACLHILRFDKARNAKTKKLEVLRGLALRRYAEYNTCIAGTPAQYWNTSRDRIRP